MPLKSFASPLIVGALQVSLFASLCIKCSAKSSQTQKRAAIDSHPPGSLHQSSEAVTFSPEKRTSVVGKNGGKNVMGSAASLLPKSEEEALARGFTREQITQFTEVLRRHAKRPAGSHVGITNSVQQPPPSAEYTPSRASSVFASAGLSSIGSNAAQSNLQVAVPVNNTTTAPAVAEPHQPHSASATLRVQARPSQRRNTINRRIVLPRPVFPASASAASTVSATAPVPSTRIIQSASAASAVSGASSAPAPSASCD